METSSTFDVVIIGAGISGLTCAFRLANAGARVAIVEASQHIGGYIRTERHDGYLLEYGPNSFSSSSASLKLLEDVNIRSVAETQPLAAHDRYVWRNGKLHKVPTKPQQFLFSRLLSLREKYQVIHGMTARFRPPSQDLTLGAYLRERLGDGAVDALVKPGIAGIYAADADRISLEGTLPRLYPILANSERLIDAGKQMKARSAEIASTIPKSLVSFPDGLETLTRTLAERLQSAGGKLFLGCAVEGIAGDQSAADDAWTVQLTDGAQLSARTIVLTQRADQAAKLLSDIAPAAAQTLESIEYAPLCIVHVGLSETAVHNRRPGFGFLTVQGHGVRALGMIWSDRIFAGRAPADHRLLTCFYGGEIDPDALALDDDAMHSQVITDLKTTMGLTRQEFAYFEVTRIPHAIPIFRVGHAQRMRSVVEQVPGSIQLLGNYTGGVSIPDRIERATELASRLLSRTETERTTTPV